MREFQNISTDDANVVADARSAMRDRVVSRGGVVLAVEWVIKNRERVGLVCLADISAEDIYWFKGIGMARGPENGFAPVHHCPEIGEIEPIDK